MKKTIKEWEKEKMQIWNDLKEIEKEHLKRARELDVDFAMDHALFQVGDVISNGTAIIRIDRVEIPDNGFNLIDPYLDYIGEVLSNKLHKPTGKTRRFAGKWQNTYILISRPGK